MLHSTLQTNIKWHAMLTKIILLFINYYFKFLPMPPPPPPPHPTNTDVDLFTYLYVCFCGERGSKIQTTKYYRWESPLWKLKNELDKQEISDYSTCMRSYKSQSITKQKCYPCSIYVIMHLLLRTQKVEHQCLKIDGQCQNCIPSHPRGLRHA